MREAKVDEGVAAEEGPLGEGFIGGGGESEGAADFRGAGALGGGCDSLPGEARFLEAEVED